MVMLQVTTHWLTETGQVRMPGSVLESRGGSILASAEGMEIGRRRDDFEPALRKAPGVRGMCICRRHQKNPPDAAGSARQGHEHGPLARPVWWIVNRDSWRASFDEPLPGGAVL